MRARVFTLAGVALVGCRAVLGIEELDVVEGSSADGGDAGEASAIDGGADAMVADATNLTDVSECLTSDSCRKCCRDSNRPAFAELEKLARQEQCICTGTECTSDCATTVCATPTQPPEPGGCVGCVDDHLSGKDPACVRAIAACQVNVGCEPAATCITACP